MYLEKRNNIEIFDTIDNSKIIQSLLNKIFTTDDFLNLQNTSIDDCDKNYALIKCIKEKLRKDNVVNKNLSLILKNFVSLNSVKSFCLSVIKILLEEKSTLKVQELFNYLILLEVEKLDLNIFCFLFENAELNVKINIVKSIIESDKNLNDFLKNALKTESFLKIFIDDNIKDNFSQIEIEKVIIFLDFSLIQNPSLNIIKSLQNICFHYPHNFELSYDYMQKLTEELIKNDNNESKRKNIFIYLLLMEVLENQKKQELKTKFKALFSESDIKITVQKNFLFIIEKSFSLTNYNNFSDEVVFTLIRSLIKEHMGEEIDYCYEDFIKFFIDVFMPSFFNKENFSEYSLKLYRYLLLDFLDIEDNKEIIFVIFVRFYHINIPKVLFYGKLSADILSKLSFSKYKELLNKLNYDILNIETLIFYHVFCFHTLKNDDFYRNNIMNKLHDNFEYTVTEEIVMKLDKLIEKVNNSVFQHNIRDELINLIIEFCHLEKNSLVFLKNIHPFLKFYENSIKQKIQKEENEYLNNFYISE